MSGIRLLIIVCCLLLSCSRNTRPPLSERGNAVYYWKTSFALNDTERAFLKDYHIGRIYCRYFDVVEQAGQGPMPNATISFHEAVPDDIELVPTVFIMEQCMHTFPDSLAARIVRRIAQMNETNDIEGVKEIQIDCDYTARSRDTYYRFLEEVRNEAGQRGMKLSTTIRLHQLSMPEPPADYGVLMLYNTGSPDRFFERRSADGRLLQEGRNPILDLRDVKPYLRHLKGYALPLAAAYPVFQWQRTFHGVHLTHEATFDDIIRTKQAVEAEREDLGQLILTYHLSEENIHRYQTNQYETIYHH